MFDFYLRKLKAWRQKRKVILIESNETESRHASRDFIIYVYCCVVDNYTELVSHPLRSRGFQTKLSDAEVITMEIVGEFMGKETDQSLWRYFQNHWHDWFPNLGSRANFVKQSANLWLIKERIIRQLADNDRIHLIDGFPLPVCQITRAARSRCFQGEAGYIIVRLKMKSITVLKGILSLIVRVSSAALLLPMPLWTSAMWFKTWPMESVDYWLAIKALFAYCYQKHLHNKALIYKHPYEKIGRIRVLKPLLNSSCQCADSLKLSLLN